MTEISTIACAQCSKPITPEPGSCGTGYGIDRQDRKVCYACCAENDRAEMIATGRMGLYLTVPESALKREEWNRVVGMQTNHPDIKVSNWPGSLAFKACARRIKGSAFGRPISGYYAWFVGPDGYVWSGRNMGDSQIIRAKRTREVWVKPVNPFA